jgi:alkanesulfonate monooxygenase SsuD/methylene tetrahydromethanopterin reductase-like flavin-dependent oxidoreductase (luciferase family)
MGFNALTYVLAFLIALSGAANVFLGDGWLLPIINPDMAQEQREAVDARRQQEVRSLMSRIKTNVYTIIT